MNSRIKSLDGLKGLICIPIVFIHYRAIANHYSLPAETLPYYNIFAFFYNNGAMFVTPFYWISGYLVERQYSRIIADFSLYSFLRRRLKTLYPMAFASTTIGIVFSIIDKIMLGRQVTAPIDLKWIALNYLLVHDSWVYKSEYTAYGSGTWFVSVLLLCYIYYYLIARISSLNIRYYIYAGIFILGASGTDIPIMWSSGSMCAFFGGVLLYRLFYDQEFRIVKNIDLRIKNLCFVIAFILCASVIFIVGLTDSIMLFVFSPLLIMSSISFKPLVLFLETGILQILGKLSMSIYLSHLHVERGVFIILAMMGSSLTFFAHPVWYGVMGCCLLFACAYYEMIEKKFVSKFNRFLDIILY